VIRRGVLLLLLFGCVGCGMVKSPTEPPSDPGTGTALTFSQIQAQVFTPTCAKAGCHAASSAQAGLVLEAGQAYGNLVGRSASERSDLARVQPGDPERSYLILKLRGDPSITGLRMPQDGPPYLTSEQIDGIAAWIRAGAPNN
jgi:rubredoxin